MILILEQPEPRCCGTCEHWTATEASGPWCKKQRQWLRGDVRRQRCYHYERELCESFAVELFDELERADQTRRGRA